MVKQIHERLRRLDQDIWNVTVFDQSQEQFGIGLSPSAGLANLQIWRHASKKSSPS